MTNDNNTTKVAQVFLMWDFDAAIGQINSSYPYNYHEELIYQEINNVETILELSSKYEIPMIFSITGFAAEKGIFPFHIPELIKRIYSEGHEIASHSWRHEWLPFLEIDQLFKTLNRSKIALEECIGEKDAVKGFVPPFSRPMTWLKKGAFSLGDKAIGPAFRCNDIQKIIPVARSLGYKWMRVTYKTLTDRFFKINSARSLQRKWTNENGLACIPNNYVGFDEDAKKVLSLGIKTKRDVIISAHPSGLTRAGSENIENFQSFLNFALKERDKKELQIKLLKDSI